MDGVHIIHVVHYRYAMASYAACGRVFGSDETQPGHRTPTCLQCIAQDGRATPA